MPIKVPETRPVCVVYPAVIETQYSTAFFHYSLSPFIPNA